MELYFDTVQRNYAVKLKGETSRDVPLDVKIGTTWIEPLDYEQFIYELLNTPRRARAVRSQFYNTGM